MLIVILNRIKRLTLQISLVSICVDEKLNIENFTRYCSNRFEIKVVELIPASSAVYLSVGKSENIRPLMELFYIYQSYH